MGSPRRVPDGNRTVKKAAPWAKEDGEMARRIREFDWGSTSMGPVAGWPQSLGGGRTANGSGAQRRTFYME